MQLSKQAGWFACAVVVSWFPQAAIAQQRAPIELNSSFPGSRIALFEGVKPIATGTADSSGHVRFGTVSLAPGRHWLKAVEWGSGKGAAEPFAVSIPPSRTDEFSAVSSQDAGAAILCAASAYLSQDGTASLVLAGAGTVRILPQGIAMPGPSDPTAIVSADFTGSGRNDLAIADAHAGIGILMNRGDGTLAAMRRVADGVPASGLAVADFNGDGIPDLAIASQSTNQVLILIGKGDGTFADAVPIATGLGPAAIVAADFNGDGIADLATADFVGDTLTILLGNGDGAFRTGSTQRTGRGPVHLAAEDFNEDGAADLAVLTRFDNSLVVLLNDGRGAFQQKLSNSGALAFTTGDFNGDGHMDLMVYDGATALVRVHEGDGAGVFTPRASFSPGVSASWLLGCDFHGEGRLDAAVVASAGAIRLFHGTVVRSTAGEAGSRRAPLSTQSSAPMKAAISAVNLQVFTSSNGIHLGQALTITARLGITPGSGTVTFYDGSTVLGSKPATGSSVAFTTTLLPAGRNNIFAHFSGNASYHAATSTPTTVYVMTLNQQGFAAEVDYSIASSGTASVAMADFNGDGNADLVLLDGGQIQLYLGNGDGTFRSQIAGRNNGGIAIVAGDFNLDGFPDIAVAGSHGLIFTYLGDGHGNFSLGTAYQGPQANALAVADLDGDGIPDFIIGDQSNNVCTMLSSATIPYEASCYNVGAQVTSLAAGDVNQDGFPDVVAGTASNFAAVLLNRRDGSFDAPVRYTTGNGPGYVTLLPLTINDSKLHIAVANQGSNTVSFLQASSNGTFLAAVNYSIVTGSAGSNAGPSSITWGDFTGGGAIGLAVAAHESGANRIYTLTQSNGVFAAGGSYASSLAAPLLIAGEFNSDERTDLALAGSCGSTCGAIGILNGIPVLSSSSTNLTASPALAMQGQPETLTATVQPNSATGTVLFYQDDVRLGSAALSSGTATLVTPPITASALGPHTVRAEYMGDLYHASSIAHASFTLGALPPYGYFAPSLTQLDSLDRGRAVATGDFNNDGKPDVIAVFSHLDGFQNYGLAYLFIGDGNGGVQSTTQLNLGSAYNWNAVAVAVGDFNNDHNLDVVVLSTGTGLNRFRVFLGNGNGTFQTPVEYAFGGNSVAVGDFNGDGKLDLAISSGEYVQVMTGNGDGSFQSPLNVAVSADCEGLAVADFNGDGIDDIAVGVQAGVSIVFGAASGNFTASSPVAVEPGTESHPALAAGDFNGDGIPDVGMVLPGNNQISVLIGKTNGTFQPAVRYATGNTPSAIAAADFEGTGKLDLAVANKGDGTVSILHGNGDGTFSGSTTYPNDLGVNCLAAADFNRDGRWDFVTGSANDGVIQITLALASPSLVVQTSPPGLLVTIDNGTPQATPVVVPFNGQSHTVGVIGSQVQSPSFEYVFNSWSDGLGATHTIQPSPSSATITAAFDPYYYLTILASPTQGGTTTPSGYYKQDSYVPVSATAAAGYGFTGWSGQVQNGAVYTTGAATVTANFAQQFTTFNSSPSGLLISVDGGTPVATPFSLPLAGQHLITAVSPQPQSNGKVWVFSSWSDGYGQSHYITAGSGSVTYTATFSLQYALTIVLPATGAGQVTPASGTSFAPGTVVTVSITVDPYWIFSNWYGPVSNQLTTTTTVTMNGPETITASMVPITWETVNLNTSPPGMTVTYDGYPATAPVTLALPHGTYTIAVPTTQQIGPGARYSFTGWSDGNTQASRQLTSVIGTTVTLTANYTIQYQLTGTAFPSNAGTVTASPPSPDGYYNTGTRVSLTATPQGANKFYGFAGALTGTASPQTVTMTAPRTVTGWFTAPPNPQISGSITFRPPDCCDGPRYDLVLTNTGPGDALNAQLTSLTATVLTGSGTVVPGFESGGLIFDIYLPIPIGALPNGAAYDFEPNEGDVYFTTTGNVSRVRLSWTGTVQTVTGATLQFSGASQIVLQ